MKFEVLETRYVLAANLLSDLPEYSGHTSAPASDVVVISHAEDDNHYTQFDSSYVAQSMGEDAVAPLTIPRGRPILNSSGTTFVADNGNLLRGPFASTEWGNPPPLSGIQSIKNFGANAIHLYGEVFNPSYTGVPGPGDEPGYAVNRIDQMVQMTRDEGLYLVLTIGNGGNNGSFNYDYVMDFWEFYAPRYKDETHVIYEIQNEPHAWSAPYPQAALDMEADAYTLIRSLAPDTPILLFSFAVLGSGPAAVADIAEVSAAASIDWQNAGVAIHGYAGYEATTNSVEYILNAGYPVFMTEFAASDWGTHEDGLDVEMTAELERLNVSWLTFQHIPPNFIGAAYTDPNAVYDRVNRAGLSWEPDFGSWPAERGVYENGGVPRTTTGLGGTLRIEAEHFDTGVQGVAYSDVDTVNHGNQLRPHDGVDIERTADTGGGYDISWTADGEWLDYTIFVTEPGFHELRLRVASNSGGAVRVVANGKDKTGQWDLPNTGGQQTWTTVTRQVFLEAGRQKLSLEILTGGFNLNWIELSPVSSGAIPNGNYKILNRNSALAVETDVANNRIVQSTYTGASNELWSLTHRGAGQYSITSVSNGWSWNTFYDRNDEPLTLAGWGYDGHPDRRFIIVPEDDGYFNILVVDGGLSVEIDGASSATGAIAQQYEYSGASHQQWAVLAPAAPAFPTGLSAAWGDPSAVPGDYDSNGAVNGRDFLAWQRHYGTNFPAADGDGNGTVDGGDKQIWASSYGHQTDAAWVQLSWNVVAGATSYNIKRSSSADGPFETIATQAVATTYADLDLIQGGSYYYVVSASSSSGESLHSAKASPPLLHAHLEFDQAGGSTATDATGNGWNGTLVNGPVFATGIIGNAVDLDGTNDYVNLPVGIVHGLAEITIAAWVRLDAISSWARLFDFGSGTNVNMFLAPRSGITSRPVFAITTSGAGGEQRINSNSVTIGTNAWTHVAVTIAGATGILYVDGAEVGRNSSMSLTPAALGTTTQNYIGRSQYSADPYLNGRVDDFRIYDEALSAAEISMLAAAPLSSVGLAENMAALLQVDAQAAPTETANDVALWLPVVETQPGSTSPAIVERIDWRTSDGYFSSHKPDPRGELVEVHPVTRVSDIASRSHNRDRNSYARLADMLFGEPSSDWKSERQGV